MLTEQLDHRLIAEKGNRFRFAATDSPGNYVDIICSPDSLRGLAGSGTVHHLAFSTPTRATQNELRLRIVKRMLNPTPVLDRNYFASIYFREPGGGLFEVATAGPGFAMDETPEHLGEALKLPERYEHDRLELQKNYPRYWKMLFYSSKRATVSIAGRDILAQIIYTIISLICKLTSFPINVFLS